MSDPATLTCSFTIGGAVYGNLSDPLGTGEEAVEVCATCQDAPPEPCAITTGAQGLWQIEGVLAGTCELTVKKEGCTFQHVVGGIPGNPPPITITVDEEHKADNQSIQFLVATCGGACCVDGGCLEKLEEAFCEDVLDGVFAGPGVNCEPNPCVGACCIAAACVAGQTEPNCTSAGGQWSGPLTVCFEGVCPLCDDGDADEDGDVDMHDFAWLQVCFGATGTGDCKCLDMDNDNNVDLDDNQLFFKAGFPGP